MSRVASSTSVSETVTENIFRAFHGPGTFIEKSAIPNEMGFRSKKNQEKPSEEKGFPDFFLDSFQAFSIVVEAKAINHNAAVKDIKYYMKQNTISKPIIGIAVSGQSLSSLKVSYFIRQSCESKGRIKNISKGYEDRLLYLSEIEALYWASRKKSTSKKKDLIGMLDQLNNVFHKDSKIKDTDRSLFFSGLLIALTDESFRNTYQGIKIPLKDTQPGTVLECSLFNEAILAAVSRQLVGKKNNVSKTYHWEDCFSFIKTMDFPLQQYITLVKKIENEIFVTFKNNEQQDVLGRAYTTFLKRAGRIDNRNIILTPQHVTSLMVELANLHENDVVLDTCMGTGGFLMESMEKLLAKTSVPKVDQHGRSRLPAFVEAKIDAIKEKQLIGFETDRILFALACSNVFLHGDGRSNLIYGSCLTEDWKESILSKNGDDVLREIRKWRPTKCIINPPYEKGVQIKFVCQALEYLELQGKLIVIMPKPTLFYNQNGLTEQILGEAKLDFVINMPKKLFSETRRKVIPSIFGFTKVPHKPRDQVLFYDLEDDGFEAIPRKGKVDKYNKWPEKRAQLLDAIFNSNEIPGISKKKRIMTDEGHLNCRHGIKRFVRPNNFEKIGDLFNIEAGTLASKEADETGQYHFITSAKEWKTHTSYEHEKEAIVYVVGSSGNLGRSFYVNDKFTAANLCVVLTPKNPKLYPINLQFYQYFFDSIQEKLLKNLAYGSSQEDIKPEEFSEYYIKYISLCQQNDLAKDYTARKRELTEVLKLVESSKKEFVSKLKDLP